MVVVACCNRSRDCLLISRSRRFTTSPSDITGVGEVASWLASGMLASSSVRTEIRGLALIGLLTAALYLFFTPFWGGVDVIVNAWIDWTFLDCLTSSVQNRGVRIACDAANWGGRAVLIVGLLAAAGWLLWRWRRTAS